MGQRVVLAVLALGVLTTAGGCEADDGAPPDGNLPVCPNRGPAGCAEGYRLSVETCACVPDGDAAADARTDGSAPVDQEAGDEGAGDVLMAEEAEFQALTVGLGGGPCPTDQSCGGSILLRRDGMVVHEYGGQRFEGRVTGAELDVLVPLVSDARTIAELRKAPGCPPAIHATELAVVEIVPGIFVSGDISGCIEGPLAALRYHLHAVTKRLFPQSPVAIGLVVVLPTPGPRFRLSDPPVFGGFSLHRQWGPCPPSAVCAERLGVTPAEGHVLQLGGNPRGEWRGVVDFEPLSSVAVSARVIAELRKPAPCPMVTDVSETMEVIIGPRMYVRGSTAGCSDGPVAELRSAARALVVRLSGSGGADAGAADHPADGVAP